MEFKVKFRTRSMICAISIASRETGLVHLDTAREVTKTPRLNPGIVSSEVPRFEADPCITVPEEIARESGLFAERNTITVYVDSAALNGFTGLNTEISRSEETGEITAVTFSHKVWTVAILSRWREDGYPLAWHPSSGSED